MDLFLSPHCDDETLFGSFTIQKHNPLVVIVFDGHIQAQRGEPITAQQRRAESLAAMNELEVMPPLFLGYPDTDDSPASLSDSLRSLIDRHQPKKVWAPAVEDGGHLQHNLVGRLTRELFPSMIHYMTYTRTAGKSRGIAVRPAPEMIRRKLRALACYESQITLANCREHFLRDLAEYVE